MESKKLNEMIIEQKIDDLVEYIKAGKDIKNVSMVTVLDAVVARGVSKEKLQERGAVTEMSELISAAQQLIKGYKSDKKLRSQLKIVRKSLKDISDKWRARALCNDSLVETLDTKARDMLISMSVNKCSGDTEPSDNFFQIIYQSIKCHALDILNYFFIKTGFDKDRNSFYVSKAESFVYQEWKLSDSKQSLLCKKLDELRIDVALEYLKNNILEKEFKKMIEDKVSEEIFEDLHRRPNERKYVLKYLNDELLAKATEYSGGNAYINMAEFYRRAVSHVLEDWKVNFGSDELKKQYESIIKSLMKEIVFPDKINLQVKKEAVKRLVSQFLDLKKRSLDNEPELVSDLKELDKLISDNLEKLILEELRLDSGFGQGEIANITRKVYAEFESNKLSMNDFPDMISSLNQEVESIVAEIDEVLSGADEAAKMKARLLELESEVRTLGQQRNLLETTNAPSQKSGSVGFFSGQGGSSGAPGQSSVAPTKGYY